MIMLALQIYFSVRAFNNGWAWRVLIPWATTFTLSFVIGLVSIAEGTAAPDLGLMMLLEFGLLGALVYMAKQAPASITSLDIAANKAEQPAA